MKIGVTFPQTEFGTDMAALRDYTHMVEGLGFNHILAYDHVVGANPDRPGGWRGVYTYQDAFLSPFLLFSFMAAITERVELVTGVIILPQRQTVLAAKQAATLDVLSAGRLRMGVGLGWNKVEFIALNEDFHTRGRRVEEQIDLMRRLWAEPLVTYESDAYTIPDAGLNPLPVQRPIPIWLGGRVDATLRRVARMADGWLTLAASADEARPQVESLMKYMAEQGRSPDEVGVEPRLAYGDGDPDRLLREMAEWQAIGATHVTINTMRSGLSGPKEHSQAVRKFAAAVGLG